MCFYIDSQRNPDPIIATENIECYKVGYKIILSDVGEVFKSEFRYHIYPFNDKQTELQLNPDYDIDLDCWTIQEGYHSYSSLTKAILNRYSDQVVVKCVIPKGATYYYNLVDNVYVSTSIIVTKFLTPIIPY